MGDDKPAAKISHWLVGSFSVAVAIGAFAGIAGSEANRMLLYQFRWTLSGLLLLVAAVLAGVVAQGTRRGTRPWTVVGLLLFLAGVAATLNAHAQTVRAQVRPQIQTSLTPSSGGMTLEVNVTASSLNQDQYVFLLVEGANSRFVLDPNGPRGSAPSSTVPPNQYFTQRLYKSRVGSDSNGNVAASIRLPISSGLYEQIWVVAQLLHERDQRLEVDANRTETEACRRNLATACVTLLLPNTVAQS